MNQERTDKIKLFISMFILWCGLFIIIEKKFKFKSFTKKQTDDIKNRLVSIIHGVITFWGAAYILFSQHGNFGDLNSAAQNNLILLSMSYFLYDLLACIYYDLDDLALFIHHGMAMSGYFATLYSGYGALSAIYGIFCAEVSNLPMHVRMILRNVNLRFTKTHEICEYVYFILYASFRALIIPYALVNSWREPMCPLFIKLSCTGLFLQSLYYITKMKSIFANLQRQKNERQKLGVEYQWFSVSEAVLNLPYVKKGPAKEKIF